MGLSDLPAARTILTPAVYFMVCRYLTKKHLFSICRPEKHRSEALLDLGTEFIILGLILLRSHIPRLNRRNAQATQIWIKSLALGLRKATHCIFLASRYFTHLNWSDYMESIAASAARKVVSLCCVINFLLFTFTNPSFVRVLNTVALSGLVLLQFILRLLIESKEGSAK